LLWPKAMRSLSCLFALSYVPLLAAPGCGGTILTVGGDGGSDASTTSDGGAPVSDGSSSREVGTPSNTCPPSPPSGRQPCSPLGFECQYGATQPNPSCGGTLWECSPSGWVVVDGSPRFCPPPGAPCPDSYADVPVNNACPIMDQVCLYPTGSCGCTPPPSGEGTPTWVCMPLTPGCPTPIPAVGSSCINPGLTCAYSPCGGGTTIECRDGNWQLAMAVCQ
jgi:hypothetical protein